MSRIALITDLHFGVRNGSNYFHEYFRKFYENVFFPTLLEEGIKTVICLGDTFDKKKQIDFITLDNYRKYFFDKFKEYNIELYVLVGNHDAPFKNTISVNAPNLLLNSLPNISVINSPTEKTFYGNTLLLLPWLCDDNLADSLSLIENTNAKLAFGHLELSGFEMFQGQLSTHGQIETEKLSKFDHVYSGHYHHKSTVGNVTYLGNVAELTWSDFDDPRGFHILDLSKNQLTFYQNPYTMFHKFYYDDSDLVEDWLSKIDFSSFTDTIVKVIVLKKTDHLAFDTFIHNLQMANPIEFKIIEDMSEFEDSAIDEEQLESADTLTLLYDYVDGIDTEFDKGNIKRILRELYLESIKDDE